MKRASLSNDAHCSKKGYFDVPDSIMKLSLDERRLFVWNKEFPNCTNMTTKYDVICHVGQGTYGVVYKAREKGTKNFVALKKFLPNSDNGAVPLTAFREIRILQQLKHDNIICFHEVCKSNAIFFIALEYCEVSLDALIYTRQLTFTLGARKTIIRHLLSGLHFMHQNLVLHRDIKTSNLLISPSGTLKIADFGLARPIHKYTAAVKQIFSGNVVTLWYRAPELLLGERSYSSAIDIWSAGCVMAELWTRRAILTGSSEQEQIVQILKLCGSITKESWSNVETLPLYALTDLPKHFKRRVQEFLGTTVNDVHAMNLLERIFTLDPEKRIDANTALNHKFFWGGQALESLVPLLELYRNIQNQLRLAQQKEQYTGYVDHIF